VLAKVGDSLLARRRPREAAQVLEHVVAAAPEDFDSQILLSYAYLEDERHDRALALLQGLVDTNPAWLRKPGSNHDYGNWNRLQAETNLAMLKAYGERPADAQAMLEALAAIGPASPGLQNHLGTAYWMRGWPERALERQRMSHTLDPRSPDARIGMVDALVALDRTDQARPVYDALVSDFPDNLHVDRLQDYWRAHVGWQGEVYAGTGRSDQESISPLGNRDGEYGLRLQGPLLDDRWRVTLAAGDHWADFQGERVHAQRAGLGVLYAHDRLTLAADVTRSFDDYLAATSLGLRAGWRFSDTWRAEARVRSHDPEASLQARRFGIGADSVQLEASWRPSESGRAGLSLGQWRYDDGNRRDSLLATGQRRVSSQPHLLVDVMGEAYASRGSLDDRPYFNPASDRSWNLGLRLDHLPWRHYERHFRHRLDLWAGQYWQETYGSAWVPRIEYRHEWRLGIERKLNYGLSWSRPVYDGQREQHLGLDLRYYWGH